MYSEMNDVEVLEFLTAHPFGGGNDEGEGDGGGTSIAEGDHIEVGGASSRDSGRDASQWIPKHRFDEVNGKMRQLDSMRQEMEKLGFKSIQELQEFKKRADDMGKGRNFTDTERDKLRGEMEEIYPELAEFREFKKSQSAALYRRSESYVDKFVKELGWEAKVENNHYLQDFLAPIISKDPDLKMQFQSGEVHAALDEAWKRFKGKFGISQMRRKEEARVQQIKQGNVQPGNQNKSKKDESGRDGATLMRDSLNEAGDKAFDLLQTISEE